MKGILITPETQSVEEISYDEDNIAKLLDCSIWETVMVGRKTMFCVDEEGLFHPEKARFAWFNAHQPFFGKALVVSFNEAGDFIDCLWSAEAVADCVSF